MMAQIIQFTLFLLALSQQGATELEWLEKTGINLATLPPCDDCFLRMHGSFPFGKHYHEVSYIQNNGIISFGRTTTIYPRPFPVDHNIVAPYWVDHDSRRYGTVYGEQYGYGDGPISDEIMSNVNSYIVNTVYPSFNGAYLMVAEWREMHPYPFGASSADPTPYLSANNTYQAVVITDGLMKSFGVFIYNCYSFNWASHRSTIGYNAVNDSYFFHPLSNSLNTINIGCLNPNSQWSNLVYDLTPNIITDCDDGEVRLIGGEDPASGHVVLCHDGIWRRVCSERWDSTTSGVICNMLNYTSELSIKIEEINCTSTGLALMEAQCTGTELTFAECTHERQESESECFCARVFCPVRDCDDGEVGLVDDGDPAHGYVVLCQDGRWERVCSQTLDISSNRITCFTQDFSYETEMELEDIYCTGNGVVTAGTYCSSTNLLSFTECRHEIRGPNDCHCAAVHCSVQVPDCDDGEVRLVDEDDPASGSVEYCKDGTWGRMCSERWDINNTRVICKTLNYTSAVKIEEINCTGNGVVSMEAFCTGTEISFAQCRHNSAEITESNDCHCGRVFCHVQESQVPDCDDGEVRLVDEDDPASGSVEYCQNGTWGRMCSERWDINNTRVICKTLDHSPADEVKIEEINFTSTGVVLIKAHCTGTELSFAECRLERQESNGCHCARVNCQSSIFYTTVDTKGVGIVVWSVVAIATIVVGVGVAALTVIFYIIGLRIRRKKMMRNMHLDISARSTHNYNISSRDRQEWTVQNSSVVESVSQQILSSQPPSTQDSSDPPARGKKSSMNYSFLLVDELQKSNMLFMKDEIILLDSIGKGVFGVVYKGRFKTSRKLIAVKTLNGDYDQVELDSIVEEATKMSTFDHRHVMGLIGVCLDTGSAPYLIMSYMVNGSLLDYLQREKTRFIPPDDTDSDEVEQVNKRILEMCRQIACGMEYLASNKYIHRDLAARNCMIDAKFTIKISSFGLSEDVFEKNYLRLDTSEDRELCIKWMAPECLAESFYSEKSDVWSYGVTMWEIFSGGETPSYSSDTHLDLLQSLQDGERLPKPHNPACNNESVQLMNKCWEKEIEDRPTFKNIHSTISSFLEVMSGYLELNPFTD